MIARRVATLHSGNWRRLLGSLINRLANRGLRARSRLCSDKTRSPNRRVGSATFEMISCLLCSPLTCVCYCLVDSPLTSRRAISYRTLAHTLDQAALLSAVHGLLQQQVAPAPLPPPYEESLARPVTDIVRFESRGTHVSQKHLHDQRSSSVLGFQSRWLRKAWHFETLRSYGSWTFSLRSWNILDPSAPILEIIRQDDLLEFRKRLSYGAITLDDRDPRGKTLFRVSASLLMSG